jgi:hypothetical protein
MPRRRDLRPQHQNVRNHGRQVAAEVLQQHQRNRARADLALGVVDAVIGAAELIGSYAVAKSRCGGHVAILSRYLVSQEDGPGTAQRPRCHAMYWRSLTYFGERTKEDLVLGMRYSNPR